MILFIMYVDSPGAPDKLRLNSNTTCISLTATKPDNPNGIIISYKVKLLSAIDSDNSKFKKFNGNKYLLPSV